MKKINIFLIGLLVMIGFSACQNDELVTINPKAETGEISFVLNKSQYKDLTYVLDENNNNMNMDVFTCSQPDYGFTAAVTYYVQASFNENMTDSVELGSSINGESVAINVKEMNKALLQLYKGTMPNPTVERTVYIRLKAVVSTSTSTPLDKELTVKPLFSNIESVKIHPYFMEDLVTYDKAKSLKYWYVIGLGDGAWTNSEAGVGASLVPLSVVDGSKYDSEGNGTFSYTGYIKASQGFKVIHVLGSWDTQWGNNGSEGINNPAPKSTTFEPSNFKVPEDGYYTITLNSITNTMVIEPAAITPTIYNTVGLIGEMTSWGSDVVLSKFQTDNNHVWYTEYTFAANSQCKFRANAGWDTNWGTPSAIEPDPLFSAVGLGKMGGKNMIKEAGTYKVIFNDIDGFYTFIKK